MRIVLSWLRELCPTTLDAGELADLLTSKGAEVESVLRPWERLSGVVAARVLDVRDHPRSDTLCIARVDGGFGEREVVVGVRNMVPGDVVPLAPPGSGVPSLPEPLAARDIRGVRSDGMLCSPLELGVAPAHDGILILPATLRPGDDVASALGLRDAVLDIEVTPNRPDFLSVLGVAREVAAATGTPLAPPPARVDEADEKVDGVATVEVRDPERCPRYLARIVRGVRDVASPLEMQARLTASGMRPISAVVDATNYAMLELGQPMHPFDLSRLVGRAIVVRRAAEGEDIVTLDGVARTLGGDDLVIADADRAVAVAGVMGGAGAEVSHDTTDVLLESATFERRSVQRTRRRLELSTEASMRFERGTDPEVVPLAADRACALMAEWCGADVLAGSLEAGGAPDRRRVSVRPSRASAVLGFPVTSGDADVVFDRLGMAHESREDSVEVEVPGYRVDLESEVDLIEEIVRVRGYDEVGSTLPPVRQAGGVPDDYAFSGRVRDALRTAGLREVVSQSFASAADAGESSAVALANPIVADERYLRTRLLPGLWRAVTANAARGAAHASLFEVGTVFALRDGEPVERTSAAFALWGAAAQGWAEASRALDFFDGKGALEATLEALGVRAWALERRPSADLHPGRAAEVLVEGRPAGILGELHPDVGTRLDVPGRIAVCELDVGILSTASSGTIEVRDVPRFPPVRRDVAVVVDDAVEAAAVGVVIREAAGELLEAARIFDVFRGDPVPRGRKSLAFALDFRSPDRTLTDDDVQPAIDHIVRRIGDELGAELRSA